MSSIRHHLTVSPSLESKVNKRHSSVHLPSYPNAADSRLLSKSSSTRLPPTSNSNYLIYVNDEPERKQSITVTHSLAPTNAGRKLSAISLPFPWYKRGRSPSDDKSSIDSLSKRFQSSSTKSRTSNRMSRDRLLTLFGSGTHTTTTTATAVPELSICQNDDDQVSPMTEVTALNESLKSHDKQLRENGYRHNTSHLLTR